MKTSTLIKATSLTIQLEERKIIDSSSFTINEGDFLNLVGMNGAGKSVLIQHLIKQRRSSSIDFIKGIKISYIPQEVFFVEEVSQIFNDYTLIFKAKKSRAALIKSFTLEPLMSKKWEELSSGEMQRVLLAIAFMKKPNIIILDEWAKNLDVVATNESVALLKNLRKKNPKIAFLFVTHKESLMNSISKDHGKLVISDKIILKVGSNE